MILPILRKHLSCVHFHPISCSRLFSTTAISDLLLNKYRFSPQLVSKVASSVSTPVQKDPERADSILSFLRESGFSNAQLERLVRAHPRRLSASLEDTIKPKIRAFQDLGFSSHDVANIVSSNPIVLGLNLNTRIIPSLSVLKSLLGTDDAVAKLLRKRTWIFNNNIDKTMVPNIEILKSCGVPLERIIKLINRHERSLLRKPKKFRKLVEKVEGMGVNPTSGIFICVLEVVCQMSSKTLDLKIQGFRSWGFTDSDVANIFQKAPRVFSLSADTLKRAKDVILATGKYNMSCIIKDPGSVGRSIDLRYKPRFQILEILEGKNLIKNWPSLSTLYLMTDEQFFEKFVGPYLSQVDKVYTSKWSARLHTRENQ